MRLYLVRHGKAQAKSIDPVRGLSEQGSRLLENYCKDNQDELA